MLLKGKYNSREEFEKLEAGLVAGGHQQDKSAFEELETSSPMSSKLYY
jgi:hypothetical protein